MAGAPELTTETRAAFAELCKAYWSPVYTYVLQRGRTPDDAQDLVQSFFARILEHNDLASVDPRRGRFRSWLLGALKHFLANQKRRERTVKRGRDVVILPIDAVDSVDPIEPERYAHEPTDPFTPERMYERQWALTVLERVLSRLEREYATQDKREWFEQMKGFLVGDGPSYEVLAGRLGETVETLRVRVHRLRRHYRDLLRDEIRDTVDQAADVDDELRQLLSALS